MNAYRDKKYSNVPIKSIESNSVKKQEKVAERAFSLLCIVLSISFLSALPIGRSFRKDYSDERGISAAMDVVKGSVSDIDEVSKDIYDFMSEEEIMAAALEYAEAHGPKYVFPLDGYVTSAFANRTDPILKDREEYHTGIDISAVADDEIRAYSDGVVKKTVISDEGYGIYLIIEHDGFETLYAHCDKLLVSEGDRVKAGQVVAIAGNTGRSTGKHLHFEIRIDGTPIDPLEHAEENEAKKYA